MFKAIRNWIQRNILADLVERQLDEKLVDQALAMMVRKAVAEEQRVWKARHKAYKAQRDRDFRELQDKNDELVAKVAALDGAIFNIQDRSEAYKKSLLRLRTAASPEGFSLDDVLGWVDDELDGLCAERKAMRLRESDDVYEAAVKEGLIQDGEELDDATRFVVALNRNGPVLVS